MLGSVAAELAALGYIGGDTEPQAWGFGEYSANLNTFFNSMGHSRIFATLPNMDLQYEGYCYLGAGCFLLGSVVCCFMLGRRSRARILSFPWRRWAWPLVAALACALLALASPWYWGQTTLLRVRVFRHLGLLTQSFRSSGRFIWPLAYVINLALLTAVLRALRWRRWSASSLLLLLLGIQAYDLDPVQAAQRFTPARPHAFSAPAWSLAERDYKHLVLYPAEIYLACDGPRGYRTSEVTALAYLAYRHGWTFNSGYAARLRRTTGAYCGELRQEIEHGKLSADTLYIVWRKDLPRLQHAGAVCSKIDRVHVCVMAGQNPFAMQLARPAH
jgi:hypothetical protein